MNSVVTAEPQHSPQLAASNAAGMTGRVLLSFRSWSYWLGWMALVVVGALSIRADEYHSWLLSPYAWWIAPLILWATVPRERPNALLSPLVLVILGWISWRCLTLSFAATWAWTSVPVGSPLWSMQSLIKVALFAGILAIPLRKPLFASFGRQAPAAAILVGAVAILIFYWGSLADHAIWVSEFIANCIRFLNVGVFVIVLASATRCYCAEQIKLTLDNCLVQAPPARPKVVGFFGMLLITLLSVSGFYFYDYFAPTDYPPTALWMATLFGVLPILFLTWSGVRAWKRLGKEKEFPLSHPTLRMVTGRVAIVTSLAPLWVLQIWSLAPNVGNSLVATTSLASGSQWSVAVDREHAVIVVDGEIAYGLASALDQALRENPSTSVVEIRSGGGLVSEAADIADLIKSRRLTVVVRELCASACTTVFAAGKERWLLSDAKIGYHGASRLGLPAPGAFDENKKKLIAEGFSQALAEQHAATPAWDMWYPTEEEMLAAGVVTRLLEVSHPTS